MIALEHFYEDFLKSLDTYKIYVSLQSKITITKSLYIILNALFSRYSISQCQECHVTEQKIKSDRMK